MTPSGQVPATEVVKEDPGPSLSVLITYHDEGKMLTECIDSLLAGAIRPSEIVVYDDHSSREANSFVPQGFPVRVVRGNSNVGPSRARNHLLSTATSDYVHFHDADDWFAPGWCETIRQHLEKARPDLVVTEVASIDAEGVEAMTVLNLAAVTPDTLVARAIRGSLLVPSTTFRRELGLAIGGYREALLQAEDYEFSIRLCAAAHSVQLLPRPLVRIRVHDGSRSRDAGVVYRCALESLSMHTAALRERYSAEFSDAAAAIASKLFALGALHEARAGFALARAMGRPSFAGFSRGYRWMARCAGQERAERVARLYRLLPRRFRGLLRGLP